jgi:squalene-hopene/tetraprenyl-beta-curcumene cyclase
MFYNRLIPVALATALGIQAGIPAAHPADPAGPTPKVDAQAFQSAVDRAAAYLRVKAQAPDGSYAAFAGPGPTAVITTALLRNGFGPSDPLVAKGLKYLETMRRTNGAICQAGSLYANYETCLAMMAFAAANKDGRYNKLIHAAEAFVKGEQWDEAKGQDRTSFSYGGAGYGKNKRPDLSNTQFFIDALRSIGDGPNDPAIQKALVFVSRCQNLESEYNTTGLAAKNPDGGFYYTPVGGGVSMAGQTSEGGLRSYGSMTYAGLKSMIYAGVGPDDPRVKAAFAWVQKHYSVETNPGMGDAGLYYYYHTFAKALDAMKLDVVRDANGVKHYWRNELAAEILKRQRPDGSWINGNARWLEGEPSLVTGYALLTLAYCRPAVEAR